MNQTFNFTSKTKTTFMGIAGVGLLLVLVGLFTNYEHHRFWASYLLGAFFFAAVSVLALAWITIKYAAKASWAVGFKRLSEAFAGYLPVAAISFGVLILCSFIPMGGEGLSHRGGIYAIYEWLWTDQDHVAKDTVLQGKAPYLNVSFFLIRMAVYFILWVVFYRMFRRWSLREDEVGHQDLKIYHKSTYYAAAFLPVFGLTFCMASWDWLMSTEPHWYSTIYGVNIFAGALVTFCTITAIALVLLKRNGYFGWINDSHFHDLGKFMFGFSIFWTYTWTAQFLLIWYANLPEETPYYIARMHGKWEALFFLNLIINFITPFLALMTRAAKRSQGFLVGLGILMIVGRYIDWFLAIMPGGAHGQATFVGFYEIGFFLLFGGIFGYTVCYNLSKAKLMPQNHPFLEESLHHNI